MYSVERYMKFAEEASKIPRVKIPVEGIKKVSHNKDCINFIPEGKENYFRWDAPCELTDTRAELSLIAEVKLLKQGDGTYDIPIFLLDSVEKIDPCLSPGEEAEIVVLIDEQPLVVVKNITGPFRLMDNFSLEYTWNVFVQAMMTINNEDKTRQDRHVLLYGTHGTTELRFNVQELFRRIVWDFPVEE